MADSIAEPLRGILPQFNKVRGVIKGVLAGLPDRSAAQRIPQAPSLEDIVAAQYASLSTRVAKSQKEIRTKFEEELLKVIPEDRETTLINLLQKIRADLSGLEQRQALAKVQNTRSTMVDLSLRLVDGEYISVTTPRALIQVRETVNYISLKLLDNSSSSRVNFHETTLQLLENISQRVSDPETRKLIQDKLLRYLNASPPELLRNYASKIYNAISRG